MGDLPFPPSLASLSWENLLFTQLIGVLFTFYAVWLATHYARRYKRELPKLEILESQQALKAKTKALETQRDQVEEALESRKQDLHEAQQTIDEAGRRELWLASTADDVKALERELSELKHSLRSLDTEKAELDEVRAKKATLDSEVESLKTNRHRIEGDRDRLQADKDRLEPEVQSLQEKANEFAGIETRIAEAKALEAAEQSKIERAIDELDSVQGKLETARESREALSRDLGELEKDSGILRGNKERLEADVAELQPRVEKLEEQLSLHAGVETRLEEARALLESKRGDLFDVREQITSFSTELDSRRKEHAELSGKIEGMEGRIVELRGQLEEWQKLIDAARADHAKAGGTDGRSDPCAALWKPLFVETPPVAKKPRDESQALERLETDFEKVDLQIPRRTLYAFHTALKSQDISPLTVLAGISGTGKSLLPKIYSEGMGIHFLNLPVQPGWSSPMDLFGFYNYMEGKFKAEPLARALVQFDRYHEEQFDKYRRESLKLAREAGEGGLEEEATSLTDQVLLVLLDEMNLARIEYYFSELLSRLEMRRAIDPEDPEDLKKASVPLEIGHAIQKYRHSIEIFADTNVLFTGTMNEDETTQSLADKVLDRACVLRFGRPESPVLIQPRLEELKSVEMLKRSTWTEWCMEQEVDKAVDARIGDFSDIMEMVGSPFGHRVSQAIRRYVALYPDRTIEGMNCALADQIEQKMLPKIRGREHSLPNIEKALEKLRDIAAELGDQPLSAAIRKGMESDQGTFHWSGLDRARELTH